MFFVQLSLFPRFIKFNWHFCKKERIHWLPFLMTNPSSKSILLTNQRETTCEYSPFCWSCSRTFQMMNHWINGGIDNSIMTRARDGAWTVGAWVQPCGGRAEEDGWPLLFYGHWWIKYSRYHVDMLPMTAGSKEEHLSIKTNELKLTSKLVMITEIIDTTDDSLIHYWSI